MTCILSLWRSGRGSVLPLVGLALLVLILSVGIAVDTGRVSMVQSKLNTAIDAAGLAAGATVDAEDPAAEVAKYFYANYPQNYLGSTVTSLTASSNADNTVITVNATAIVPTVLMQIVGIKNVTVNATSQITRATQQMEVVMVLDNTGSMGSPVNPGNSSVTKIDALKSAATDLVNILLAPGAQNLWIGLVPFNDTVNIGTARASWMDAAYDSKLNWGGGSWGGCVMARPSPPLNPPTYYDTSDDPPAVMPFQEFYWPSNIEGEFNAWAGSSPSAFNSGFGPNKECPQPIISMTSQPGPLIAGIHTMQPVGATTIDIGLAWGWRMLSPRWRGLWGGDMNANGLPLDYNLPGKYKAVILMTDGRNEMHGGTEFTTNPSYAQANNHYTAYGFLGDGTLGTADPTAADAELDARTLSLCTTMKNDGIIIYTIGYGSGADVNVNLLQTCASKPSFFFLAPTNADLSAAFHMIGDSLVNLRVSK